tara:strand:- start:3491 stop:4318 length:828 start_codon:yes stop_codon:yes gene_type:complete
MNIVLKDTSKIAQFSSILKNLKNFSNEIVLIVDNNQMYAQGMDSSHCCLFELVLKSSWFTEFDVEEEDSINLGINCELLSKVLNCLEQEQMIEMAHTKNEDKLLITLSPNEGKSGIKKEFMIPLMDVQYDLMVVTEDEYSVDIEMLSQDFTNLVNQLSIFGNSLAINCEDVITLRGMGELGAMNAIIKDEDILLYATEEDCKLIAFFSSSYINMITSFSKINRKIQIHINQETPMKIQYGLDNFMDDDDELPDDEEEQVDNNYIRFFLAPKEVDD